MSDLFTNNAPLGFFPESLSATQRYPNPLYNWSYKFLPMNVDACLWYANHFLLRFAFLRGAFFRISNYFITSLNIESESAEVKNNYKQIFEELRWKEVLSRAGMDLLAYGNLFLSINQGFIRYLRCPKCSKISNIEKIENYGFDGTGNYSTKCKKCGFSGIHQLLDRPTEDVNKLNVVFWNPREIIVQCEETTGDSRFFWDIPSYYKTKVTKVNNKFFSKKTPRVIYDAIYQKKLMQFNSHSFLHVKFPTPTAIHTDGRALPPSIYLFDDLFTLKVLERYNEAICLEEIVPFRVFSMSAEANPQVNPILNASSGLWSASIERMIREHRHDPGSYHTFPFPVNYQQLGAQGKNLAPVELMQFFITKVLNALHIPQELFQDNPQFRMIGPSLRLFENSWRIVIDSYNSILQHWADVISKIKGFPKVKITLSDVTLSDDLERQSIIGQLVASNSIARSELLSVYGFDYEQQLRKKIEEDRIARDLQQEEQEKEQLAASSFSGPGQAQTPGDVLQEAQNIAQQLYPLPPSDRRTQLQQIKANNQDLYSQVKQKLEEITSTAKSQGNRMAQQQAAQPSS